VRVRWPRVFLAGQDRRHDRGLPGPARRERELARRSRAHGNRPAAGHADRPVAARPGDTCLAHQSPAARPETAECIASVTGLTAQPDARLRERRNWDGSMPVEAFLALWARTRHDRDFAPGNEESSRQAGARLQAFLAGLPGTPGPVAAVTHGGITTDLLCNLLGDDALPPHLLDAGIPPCAVTARDDLNVVMIASTTHLALPPPERQPCPRGAPRPQRDGPLFGGHDVLKKY